MKQLKLILEKADKEWHGRVEGLDYFMPVSHAKKVEDVEKNIRSLIKDHQQHDDPDDWTKINADTVSFEHCYDLSDLFAQFEVLKISTVAKIAEMNPSLLRQYVTHKKYPGKRQARKIEKSIKDIAQRLSKVTVYS